MNSHELLRVDQIVPQIFKVGFNPLLYKDSGIKAR